jgi:hypothetical protein
MQMKLLGGGGCQSAPCRNGSVVTQETFKGAREAVVQCETGTLRVCKCLHIVAAVFCSIARFYITFVLHAALPFLV